MAQILLVDDDVTFRTMLKTKLSRMGHLVNEASDGAEAWKKFQVAPVDLVITDLIMPEVEGLETIQRFRKHGFKTKILAISGGGRMHSHDMLSVASHMGADAVLDKPFTHEELVAALTQLLPPEQPKTSS